MIKTKFTFLFFLIPLYSNSQLSGTIYDELKLPVENVSVFCLKNKDTLKTTFSNKNGFFEFKNISESEKDVELIMSHINYETLLTKPVKGKTYILISKQYLIDEVSVISEKKEKKNTVKRALGFIFNDEANMIFGEEIATFIPSTDKNTGKKIKSLKYQLVDFRKLGVKNNKYQPFRACIYTVDTITKKPKEKIYRSEKVRMTKNEKWFYVKIDSLDIKMPKEGLFIVLEALSAEEYNYQQVGVKGNAYFDATPSIKVKVYNPNKSNKSYRKNPFYLERELKNYWKAKEDYYFCMEFEFEE